MDDSMSSIGRKSRRTSRGAFKRSLLAMAVMSATSATFAQDDDVFEEEIIVQGVRSNLQNAQDLKRNADTFVDSISSQDIGSLPDRSVLEAMQRLPGVSIERFAAANDPDHFGVEGSGAVVRGMTATRSEFNGRDSFTANSGRGLSFQDVPPELMGGVDLYKNQTADMIEGGIGGTVSLRTRKPFDSQERQLAFSADVTYGDMVEEATPTLSGLFSDRWETDLGEFGFLFNLSYSELKASSHGIQTDLFEARPTTAGGTDGVLPGFPEQLALGRDEVYVPNGSNLTMKSDDRERNGLSMAFQWENPDDSVLATVQFMRSDATLAWTENAMKYQSGYKQAGGQGVTYPPDDETFEFDDRGIFTSGLITHVADGWRSSEDQIPNNVPQAPDDGWGGVDVRNFGVDWQVDTRYKVTQTIVDDLSFNLELNPNDTWNIELDAQYIKATTDDDDVTLMLGTRAIQQYTVSGSTPSLRVIDPWALVDDPVVQDAYEFDGNPNYLQSPTSYYWRAAMDHYERSEGDSAALRVDLTRQFEDSVFTELKFGARYADREQDVRYSNYNWGSLQPPFGQSRYNLDDIGAPILNNDDPFDPSVLYSGSAWLDSPIAVDAGLGLLSEVEYVDWSDFHRGGVVQIDGADRPNQLLHPSEAITRDYANWGERFGLLAGEWEQANARDEDENGTIDNIPGSLFLPTEINTVQETNTAAYVRLDFEGEGRFHFAGNFGLRYVKIDHDIFGSTVFPNLVPEFPVADGFDRAGYDAWVEEMTTSYTAERYREGLIEFGTSAGGDLRALGDYRNFVSADLSSFATGDSTSGDTSTSENHVLPSFNIKVEFTDDLLGRFAVAKAIALPDLGDLRAQRTLSHIGGNISTDTAGGDDPGNNGVPPGIRAIDPTKLGFNGWKASGGNPELKAMESTQFDASLEWYFADVGSLTTSLFYKDLNGFFVNGGQEELFTNPVTGQQAIVVSERIRNGGEGDMQGVEIAYQQFYDMLPEPFDGLGVQANYTYIKAEGVPNYDALPEEIYQDSSQPDEATFSEALPLQGQSEHTANFVLMYEKYNWSARLAYNWRSEYLLTTRDVITKLPVFNSAAGFMDASLFYDINDRIKVGFQAVNLLNTQTETVALIPLEGGVESARVGRSWFVNDRRYTFVVRATF